MTETVPTRKVNQRESALWLSKTAMATPLVLMVVDRFGTECFDLDPESMLEEIRDEWGIEPNGTAFDRLMAGIAIVTGDEFFQELPTFVEFCNLLAGGILDPNWFDPADTFECSWGLLEASLLNPPEDGTLRQRLSEDVIGYIEETTKYEGYVRLPAVLSEIVDRSQEFDGVDDPIIYESVWKVQEEKREDVENWIQSQFRSLGDQLSGIDFQNADHGVIKKLIAKMAGEN